jgi:hypothetical protein
MPEDLALSIGIVLLNNVSSGQLPALPHLGNVKNGVI